MVRTLDMRFMANYLNAACSCSDYNSCNQRLIICDFPTQSGFKMDILLPTIYKWHAAVLIYNPVSICTNTKCYDPVSFR